MKSSPEVFSRIFKNYARAKQILKYEIGIFKELRQEKGQDDHIWLWGTNNDNWDAEASLKEYDSDAIKHAIIKEELADGEAIAEYYDNEC